MDTTDIVEAIVGICVAIYVVAAMLPGALVSLANTTWYTVNPAVVTMATILLPILAVVAIIFLFFEHRKRAG